MQLPVVQPLTIRSTQRGALYRDMVKVVEGDVPHVIRLLAMYEIDRQAKLGNKMTGCVVDGSKGKPVEEATRSVQAWFADRKSLSDAIIAARAALIANGRLITGNTLAGLTFYYSVGKGGALQRGDPTSIAASVANPAALDLYVAIPLKQVRAWQWLTKSGRRGRRKSRDKKRMYTPGTGKIRMVSKSVFETSVAQVQRRFRPVDVTLVYIPVPNLNPRGHTPVDRIPAIKVCMKIRGRGR